MQPLDKVVAGMSCRDVLGHLGDFVDGDLAADTLQRVRAHLAGCSTCDRFGGRVATLVAALRGSTPVTDGVPADVLARVEARLGVAGGG